MDGSADPVDEIARLATAAGLTVAVAESLTGGALAARLAAGPDASTWFAGGVVAYSVAVKQHVLGVPPGPVVSETAARAMASGVSDLLRADVVAAVTGVGGPGNQEGQPPGTVWWAVRAGDQVDAGCDRIAGTPDEVVDETIRRSLERIARALAG